MALTDGLVGLWSPFMGASGYRLLDRSGRGNHGTLTNMDAGTDWVGATVNGRSGYALDFDGSNDYVESQLNITGGPFSFSMWVNLSAASYSFRAFAGAKRLSTTELWNVFYFHSDRPSGAWGFEWDGSVNSSAGDNANVSGLFPASSWQFVNAVVSNSDVSVYRNGLLQSSVSRTRDFADSSILVGAAVYNTVVDFCPVKISMVCAHNRPLSVSEISALYRLGPGWYNQPSTRVYGFVPAVGGVTGELSKTLAALSASSSGSVTAGNSGSVSSVLAALTASASGSVANGPSGSVSASLGSLTCASQGTVADGANATLNSNLAAATLSSDGTVANGLSGSLSSTLAAATLSASGNVAAGASGSLSATIGDATLSSTGNVGSGTFGSVSQTLADATLSSEGSIAAGVSGSVSQTLAAATLSSSGTLAAGVSGSVSAQLGSLTCTSTGFVTAGLNGAVDAALGSLSLASSGSVAAGNTGSATVQLASAVLSASGTVVTPSVGATLHVRINGVWKATTPFVKVNGVWKQATAYTKVNGVWK